MYFAVQQKLTQYCRASILQLEKKKNRLPQFKKKEKRQKQAKRICILFFLAGEIEINEI